MSVEKNLLDDTTKSPFLEEICQIFCCEKLKLKKVQKSEISENRAHNLKAK